MGDGPVEASAVMVERGDPTPEEIAAIVAAVQCVWSHPQAAVVPDEPMRWRFSGRWWSKPVPSRRARPA
jgi:hypothetical protein